MANEQRVVCFSGRVQGVGFRYTACRIAQRYEVTGYVRNLPDGRVELLAEGSCRQVEDFVQDVAEQMRDYISTQTQQSGPPTGGYRSFGATF